MKLKILITLLFAFISISAYSQFKTVNGTLSDAQPKKLQLKNSLNKKTNSSNLKASVDYKQLLSNRPLKLAEEKIVIRSKSLDNKSFLIEGSLKDAGRYSDLNLQTEAYLLDVAKILDLDLSDNSFITFETQNDELDMTHIKMKHYHNNVVVYGSEVILHAKNGVINSMNGRLETIEGDLNTVPSLTSEMAVSALNLKRIDFPEGVLSSEIIESMKPITKLVIHVDDKGIAKLVYHIQAYENIIDRNEYFVDAISGEILSKHSIICKFHNHVSENCIISHEANAGTLNESETTMDGPAVANAQDLFGINRTINTYQVGSQYYLVDASRSMFKASQSNMPNDPTGVIVTLDAFNKSPESSSFNYDHVTSSNNGWSGKQTGVSAHYNGSKAYEYFKNTFSREAISGNGQNIISFINVAESNGSSMDNAFWNGAAMFYGNGSQAFKPLARGLDVAGHEMTHGVVQNTANLEYVGESGALNESFADVFGVLIDRDDWLVGEDVVLTSAFPSGALRSMSNPYNGASTGDFGGGWQPKKYSERYTGSQDNGGVHINSGIPNHAFYLFASNGAVGKEKAEQVYYRALTNYMVKSSKFIDCRIAVVKAAQDLYGTSVANIAKQAFDAVEIFDGEGGDYEVDIDVNPGDDLVLFTSDQNQGLYIFTATGDAVFNPLSNSNPKSKPSITDNGDEIVFVGQDEQIHYIFIDWQTGQANEQTFDFGQSLNWRNAVISKDGLRMAALLEDLTNDVYIVDFISGDVVSYELINPTFSEGVTTGDVLYADAMEFDLSGEVLVYDAENEITGVNGSINYWDIGFLKVWNNNLSDFAAPFQIEKLFGSLPEGISVGNPTFSKNSPYILAIEVIENGLYSVLGVNIESNKTSNIYENIGLSYPNYSRTDEFLLFDAPISNTIDIGYLQLNADKISTVANSEDYLFDFLGTRWGTWFSNGDRVLTSSEDLIKDENMIDVYPNPVVDVVTLKYNNIDIQNGTIEVLTETGQTVRTKKVMFEKGNIENIDLTTLPPSTYYLKVRTDNKISVKKIIKI